MKGAVSALFLSVVLMFGACSARYYQIYGVRGNNVSRMSDCLMFKDENCSVIYNFWSNGGVADFIFVNNTDSILYLDLEKSFFIRNGMSYDYFEDAVYVSGSGKYYGTVSDGFLNISSARTSYITSKNTVSEQVSYSAKISSYSNPGPSKYEFVVKQERPVVLVPPYGSKMISKFVLWDDGPYTEDACSKDLEPKDSVSYTYSIQSSPLVFSNYITYSVGKSGEPVHIDNMFYVSDITNVKGSVAVVEEKYQCEGEYYPRTVTRFKSKDAGRFYIKYYR